MTTEHNKKWHERMKIKHRLFSWSLILAIETYQRARLTNEIPIAKPLR